MDAFCGPGGNVLSFARHQSGVSHVTAVDISRDMLRIAHHNASIYQIPSGKIRFVEGDILQCSEELKIPSQSKLGGDWSVKCIDAIFMSPPWGGTKYKKREGDEGFVNAPAFDLDAMPVSLCVSSVQWFPLQFMAYCDLLICGMFIHRSTNNLSVQC